MLKGNKHNEKNKKYNIIRRIGRTVDRGMGGGLQLNSTENSLEQELKEVRELAVQLSSGRIFKQRKRKHLFKICCEKMFLQLE